MAENIVDIHLPLRQGAGQAERSLGPNVIGYDRPLMAQAILERGLGVTFSHGTEAYNLETRSAKVFLADISGERTNWRASIKPAEVALDSIKAIRNIAGVIDLDGNLPELNHPKVREIIKDRATIYDLLLPLGLARTYSLWHSAEEDITTALCFVPGDELEILPAAAEKGLATQAVTKKDLVKKARDGRFDSRIWIIQEQVKLQSAEGWRALCFGRDADDLPITSYVQVPTNAERTGLNPQDMDNWSYIEQALVPAEVALKTDQLMRSLEKETGIREFHVAIDWAKAAGYEQTDPSWLPLGIYASDPLRVRARRNHDLAVCQIGMLADQLIRVANTGSAS